MPCFRPLTAWRGELTPAGKRKMVFKAGESAPGLSAFPDDLPCGQCFGCRLDYSCDWAMRCDKESQMHERNSFITVTYDPEFAPVDGSLQLEDWQKLVHDLRRKCGAVRYFHAGEYGDVGGRMHDHALLFGVDFDDRQLLKFSPSGERIYTSKLLSEVWGKGYCSVGDATFKSAQYVAKYCLKKVTKERAVKNEFGQKIGTALTDEYVSRYLNPVTGNLVRSEYVSMSRNPGIGYSWFQKYWRDVYPHDYVVVRGGAKMPPPRYFDYLAEKQNLVDMKTIKLSRIGRCSKKEEVWNDVLQKMQWLDVARADRLQVMEEWMKSRFANSKKNLEAIR